MARHLILRWVGDTLIPLRWLQADDCRPLAQHGVPTTRLPVSRWDLRRLPNKTQNITVQFKHQGFHLALTHEKPYRN